MTDHSATIERDLAAVEAALASGTAAHEDAEARSLQELALALRADAPAAAPEFAAELRGRMERGFPRGARDTRRHRRIALERLSADRARRPSRLGKLSRDFAPVAGVLATIAVIAGLTVVFAGGSNGGDDASVGSGAYGGGGAAESAPQPDGGAVGGDDGGSVGGGTAERAAGGATEPTGGDAPASSLMPPPDSDFAPRQLDRKIERSYSLELDVRPEEMTRVADGVTEVTNRHGGFVLDSSVTTGEDGGGGDFSLRIPTERLRPALRDLAELAPVISQSQQGRDVTRRHVTAKDRLQAARAERNSLLRRLEEADTDEEAEAIRRGLDLVSAEINGLRAQLRDLRLRTDYAVVNVSLLSGDGNSGSGGAGSSFDDAMNDAGDLLVGTAGILIRILAIAIPLGLIALVAWLAARAARRRRRESALA
jgi:hypothetical protein